MWFFDNRQFCYNESIRKYDINIFKWRFPTPKVQILHISGIFLLALFNQYALRQGDSKPKFN